MLRCITGGYEALRPIEKKPGWEYICVTDNPLIKSGVWDVKLIEDNRGLDPVRLARRVKILFWEYTGHCDICVWVDGNIDVIGDLDELCDETGAWSKDIVVKRHPERSCIYQEYIACKKLNKDNPDVMSKQIKGYQKAGMPGHFGLLESGFIIRRLTEETKRFMIRWFMEVQRKSRRDQLSFDFVRWYTKASGFVHFYDPSVFNRYFHKNLGHNGGEKFTVDLEYVLSCSLEECKRYEKDLTAIGKVCRARLQRKWE